jgi:pyridoxamine 5'-phosphate oxidase
VVEFGRWLDLAYRAGEPQPNAMALATADGGGDPSLRMVLLHQADERGFAFFTNYESRKAQDLAVRPRAALCFYWPLLHRQVRVVGPTELATRAESEAYWTGRPYGSRLSALASPQSRVIAGRQPLEAEVARLQALYPESPPLPGFWGGFRVRHETMEFWQGRSHRLHDRLRYTRTADQWRLERLAP